jgi:RHS repeat-associated protein
VYDACGAMTQNKNKGIALIDYDFNGMPTRIQFMDGSVTENIYSAEGVKLKTIHRTAVSGLNPVYYGTRHTLTASETQSQDSTRYVNNLEIDKIYCSKFYFGNGYIALGNTGSGTYHYTVKDHLGNIRTVVNNEGTIEQINNYFAYGGLQNDVQTGADVQTHKYNGKELDRMHGLDTYDYGARNYDAVLGQFNTMDPLCEKYYHISPYAYCGGNPVNRVDPDGRSTRVSRQEDGTYVVIGGDFDDDLNIYVYTQDENGEYTVKGASVGVTTSITSFYDSDYNHGQGAWAVGSVIDPNDASGKDFLSKMVNDTPPLFDYMQNARNGKLYDFKVTNGTPEKADDNKNHYRGMYVGKNSNGQTIYTSARDIGNFAAGYVAAINGMSWRASRMAFDLYQSYTNRKLSAEGISTNNAEAYGWRMGYNHTNSNERLINFLKSVRNLYKKITSQF